MTMSETREHRVYLAGPDVFRMKAVAIWPDVINYQQCLYRTRFLGHKFVSCGGPE